MRKDRNTQRRRNTQRNKKTTLGGAHVQRQWKEKKKKRGTEYRFRENSTSQGMGTGGCE